MTWSKAWDGSFLCLTPAAGNTDNFIWTTEFPDYPQGVSVLEIQVVFSAANDKIVIRNNRTTGAEVLNFTSIDGSSVAKRFYGSVMKPVILHADQVYTTPENWRVILHVRV